MKRAPLLPTAMIKSVDKTAGEQTAGTVIVAALADEIEALLAAEPAVRADVDDSVHQMRVAARRLRSVLGTCRPLLARAPVEHIREELRWLGGILGAARDAEVSVEVLQRELAALPASKVRGPVRERLVGGRQTDYAGAHAVAIAALNSSRWADLRVQLSALAVDPPLRRAAGQPGPAVVRQLIGRDFKRLGKLIDAADAAAEPDRVGALHEVRKSAKRLRYAAETMLGNQGAEVAGKAKNLQGLLGDHRDATEARHLVEHVAVAAKAAGEDPFTYRLLAKAQTAAADKALRKYTAAKSTLRIGTTL